MRTLWILAAAATFAACHNRSNEETGAAPDRGDTTGVSTYDTSQAANPSAAKYDTTHVSYDTSATSKTGVTADTTMTRAPQTGQYDSTGASQPSGVGTDTTMSPTPSPSSNDSSWNKQNSSSPSSSSSSSDTSSYSK